MFTAIIGQHKVTIEELDYALAILPTAALYTSATEPEVIIDICTLSDEFSDELIEALPWLDKLATEALKHNVQYIHLHA